jgi:hypothetical protein
VHPIELDANANKMHEGASHEFIVFEHAAIPHRAPFISDESVGNAAP